MKNFIITSYTEGRFSIEKKKLLRDLVLNIKRLVPDSYVFVTSNECNVEEAVQSAADYILINKHATSPNATKNEVDIFHTAVDILNAMGKDTFYKFVYDTVIDERNVSCLQEWEDKLKENPNLDFVGTQWSYFGPEKKGHAENGMGTWLFYGKTKFIKDMFVYADNKLHREIERNCLDYIKDHKLEDRVFLYNCGNDMLGGTWFECGDIINHSGKEMNFYK